jgi:hypothetical protein
VVNSSVFTISDTPTSTTSYYVRGMDNNSCVNTSTIIVNAAICTGINEQSGGNNYFRIYPNPCNDHLFIESKSESGSFKIFDPLGREILKGMLNDPKNTINLNEIPSGSYYIEIDSGAKKEFFKILKRD